jgi:hypothetical protein
VIVARAAFAAAILALALDAGAEPRVTLVDTSPEMPAVVAVDEPVFLRLEYSGADGSTLWARPYFRGEPVSRTKTNASRKYEGSGTGLVWFSLDDATRVDEVRIRTGGGKPYKESDIARFPIDVRGTGTPGSDAAPRALWVTDLIVENEAIIQKLRSESPPTGSASDVLLFTGFGFAVLGLIAVGVLGPLWAMWKWRGTWRWLAALPFLVMAFVLGRVVIDSSRDPTSHNLWPFEVLMFGGGGLAFFAVLVVLRRILRRPT